MMASAASATLNIDVRATRVNGAPLGAGQTNKMIPVVNVGDVISFDIFAVISGTNTNNLDDKIVSAAGSFLSTGLLKGNLIADIVPTVSDTEGNVTNGYDASGASVGLQQDLDGDGDLDVGSNNDSSAENFWAVRYQSTSGQTAGTNINGRKVGFGTFTVTAVPAGSGALINFDGRNAATAANYFQDNAFVSEPTQNGLVPLQIGGGTVPEPATLSLAGLAGLAMVRRRRA
jgi:hypothetical protein